MSQPVGTGVNVLTCPRCTLKAVNLRYLIRHIGIRHSQERNFSITCGIDGCRKFFKLYESFRRHVYRNHRNVISREVGEPTNDVMLPTDCADEVYNAADSVDSSSALYPRRARSALGVDTVLTLDVCLYVCMYVRALERKRLIGMT